MSYEVYQEGGKPIYAWTKGVQVEEEAKLQLYNLSKMPFIHKHVAAMPDVHWGMGATVGSVIATKGAIIPAAVGVDIGCGMMAVQTSLKASDLPDNLGKLRSRIEAAVPHGRTNEGGIGDRGAWRQVPDHVHMALHSLRPSLGKVLEKAPILVKAGNKVGSQAGTLGTGNHFIEVCLDEDQNVWCMLHSGSRGIGNSIGRYYIEKAKKDMERWFINLPDKDLAYIPEGSETFGDYCAALHWAQEYAKLNRELMMGAVIKVLREEIPKDFACDCQAVNCHHNYVSWERHYGENVMVTRKGAVNAESGKLGIIPGSMGAKSYIVQGKGNREAFNSCSHGAGRAMSRNQAAKSFTLEDHARATAGVECRKDAGVLDETPGAYKDIDAVMEAQKDLVDIKHTLKQVLCVKG